MSVLIFISFCKQLNTAFSDQLKAGAAVVASKVNINPRIVPLPHGDEQFSIIYTDVNGSDTLYADENLRSIAFAEEDSTFTCESFRGIAYTVFPDNGGTLKILYALPADSINRRINIMLLLIFAGVTIGAVLAALLAYNISGKILKPVMEVIDKANKTNIRAGNTARINSNVDDTELRELTDSFNRMIERISEQSQRQSAFFASASHELRTPLSVMQTRLQVMLQQANGNADNKNFLGEQLSEVKRLTKMVNDFLLMTEFEQGNMQLHKQPADLTEIIPQVIETYRQKAGEKGLSAALVFLPPDADFIVPADITKLNIMFSNLLDNAIKYSIDNQIIRISCVENKGNYNVSFINKIRPDIQPDINVISKEFYHAKPLRGEGIGLGLWITHALAEMQGMNVSAAVDKNEFKINILIKSDAAE